MSFFDKKDFKRFSTDSVEYQLAKSAERAVAYRDSLDSLDSKWVIDTHEGIGRLEVIKWEASLSSRILLPTSRFEDKITMEVPQVYDFLSGIESMVAKEAVPDWTGCGRQYPIRHAYQGNKIRAKYTQALADGLHVGVLVNPGRTELYTFPEAPLYYSYDQPWHADESRKNREAGRTIVTEVPLSSVAYLSLDTWDGRWFPMSVMLVPHPEAFRRNYRESQVDWNGTRLRYRWNSRMFHDVSVYPMDNNYYTTQATDRMLQCDDRAYWLFTRGVNLGARFGLHGPSLRASPDFRISYQSFVKRLEVKDGLSLVSNNEEGSCGVDLDQAYVIQAADHKVLAVYSDDMPIGRPQSQICDGDVISRYRLPVYIQNGKNLYLDLPGELITVTTIKKGQSLIPIIPDAFPVVIFGSYKVLENNFYSFYMKHRPPSHRSIPYLKTSALSIAEALNQECSFIKYASVMETLHGWAPVRTWIVLLRHNGLMLHRHDSDRYVMDPVLPGLANSQEVWNRINGCRQVKILFRYKVSKVYVRKWLLLLKRNKLEAYYDDYFEQLIIMDPYNDNGVHTTLIVDNEDEFSEVRLDGDGARDCWVVHENVEYVTQAPVRFYVRDVLCRLARHLGLYRPSKYTLVPICHGRLLSPDDFVPPRIDIIGKDDCSPSLWKQYQELYL